VTADNPPGGNQPEQGALGGALRRAVAGYRRRMDQELAAAGFADRRFPDGRVLHMCSGADETTISDIGRGLGITRQGASKIVAGLRDRGYVQVTPSPADGREKILTLTPRAAEFLEARRRAARTIEAGLRDEIGADEMGRLLEFLNVVAGEDALTPDDRAGETPALRALRWWDADERARPADGATR
jgi:DNA-binding MarR family transcriptional regulator